MNPFADFAPDNFEPLRPRGKPESDDRKRVAPPKELPTFNIKPKEFRVGQMIGMYESKQDLYLIFAWRCNEMQKKIDELETKVANLEKQK